MIVAAAVWQEVGSVEGEVQAERLLKPDDALPI